MSADALKQARAALAAFDFAAAERIARVLVVQAPSADAYEVLAGALRGQDRIEDALAASDAGLKVYPQNVLLRHGHAQALSRLGRYQESLAIFDALARGGVTAAALWLNRGAALMGLARAAEAEAAFADGVRRWPDDMNLQNALADVRWIRGAGDEFALEYENAVRRWPDALQLRLGCADRLRRADLRDKSEQMLREGLARGPGNPYLVAALGVVLDELDRTSEALPLLQRALTAAPGDFATRGNYIAALLRASRSDEALAQLAPLRKAQPFIGDWIAYEGMALRQKGDARYHELFDYDLMVQPFDLEAPNGYASMAAFNEALRDVLDRLHVLEAHPLDQSLRGGSQTTRSLLAVEDPVVKQYLQALEEPIHAYIATMKEPDHPWSGRKTNGFKFAGAWSVKLKPNGFHINHLHPQGWISSAYYVSLPEVTRSGDTREGWIRFGEPRWPTPGCAVEKMVQPKEGSLVLFPSYMWHGTTPFSQGERLTAPFDVVPR